MISAVCLTAIGLSALVVGGASSSPVVAQTAPINTVGGIVDAVRVGGAYTIQPGSYQLTETLNISVANTKLESAVAGQAVVLVAASGSRVLNVSATGVTINGFTITGGSVPTGNGGGINVASRAGLSLLNSTITVNTARDGGGISSDGILVVENSTINRNTASGKGGGIRDNGTSSATVTTSIVNSTFNDNTASQGGAFSSAGRSTIRHATIVGNKATNSSSAGVDRNGGTLVVRSTIIGANIRTNGSTASDCSGTPELRDVNLISNTSGCNPVSPPIVAPPLVGPLANNGGPTFTMRLLDGSRALDAISATTATATTPARCSSGQLTDQRGSTRPAGPACDVGAFERGRLGVTATLTVETPNYSAAPRKLTAGTVEVGVTSVPTAKIAAELAVRAPANPNGTVDSSGLRAIGLRAIGLRAITLQDIGLRAIDTSTSLPPEAAGLRAIEVKANGLRQIGLRQIGLRQIGLRQIGLRQIGLRAIPLSDIPLLKDGGWDQLLKGTQFEGLPLQSITLEDISQSDAAGNKLVPAVDGLTLESIDLSSTGLRAIALQSILLSGTGLRAIPLPPQTSGDYARAWCVSLFDQATCVNADGTDTPFVATLGDASLWEAQLAGGNVGEASLTVPLAGLANPQSTGLRQIGLRQIGLRQIFLENTGLRQIGLRQIGLRAIGDLNINTLFNCTPSNPTTDPCRTDLSNTLTLGDVVAGCLPTGLDYGGATSPTTCLLKEGATVGQLLDLLGVRIDGVGLLDGLNLFDILFAFVPPEDVPWEAIELDGALLQNVASPAQPTFDYVTTVTITDGPADVDVSVLLPEGFAVAAGANAAPATWCPGTTPCTTPVAPRTPLALGNPKYRITGVPTGVYRLRVPVRAGLTVGPATDFPTSVAVTAVGPNGAPPIANAGPVGVTVVEAASGGPGRAPVLTDGQLQLGHIGSSNDVDVYSFTTPAGATGASARILLSNIPDGVDYDLSVYGPQPASLRGVPTRTLNSLGDVKFDLDPADDALSTDIANDIAIDINQVAAGIGDLNLPPDTKYALRDISSRRSSNDEEVTVPALAANQKYVVVVSGYFGDLSPQPYGLRVRLDRRTALPVCAASTIYPTAAAAPAGTIRSALDVTSNINTLYVTNSARLNAEFPGRAANVITAIEDTEGINGVDAGLLLVDNLPEWNAWNSSSCSPDARNAVVKAIGTAIDGANTAKNIKNVVIVGGDGVVPMAAVPDLTEYSNESTFAREVLSPTTAGLRSNSLSGTVGSGYLLSDNPYATDAGISILGGDHELYVPDRAIGRLVETADEIIGQLQNFTTFGGRLDPSTFNNTAAVTGYDFLDDGAQEVTSELTGAGFNVSTLLQDTDVNPTVDGTQLWDRAAYLKLLEGKDYSILSPNAHFDFESLLPAAADAAGYFTENQLVNTSDVEGPGKSPASALVFTVGCHAGLSVSDVQLGFPSTDPTLDWAQLNARRTNQYVGHTTYGYGDTVIVAYSERLSQLFAGNVSDMARKAAGASPSLGAAVRDAKQQYLASTLVLTPYDEKVMQSWTYYGLPMYTLGDIIPSTLVTSAGATTLSSSVPAALAAPAPGPATFGNQTSGPLAVTIDLPGSRLAPKSTTDGTYYSVDGNTVVAQYRPVQPLVDVTIPGGRKFGGFLITGLTSEDLPSTYRPFVSRPMIDNSADESRLEAGDDAFPATLQRVTDIGDGQRLLVAAGQYETNQRLFRQVRGELLPRTGTDTVAPRFIDVTGETVRNVGTAGRGGVQFDITTDSDATRVVVVYRELGSTQWKPLELAGTTVGANKRWFGSAALTTAGASVEFFAQGVDASGNVGITSNKIENFLATEATDAGSTLDIVPIIPPNFTSDGRFVPSGTKFVIQGAVVGSTFSVDSGTPLPYNTAIGSITVVESATGTTTYDPSTGILGLSAGAHVLFATDSAGNRVYRFFVLDPAAPTITFTPDTTAWQQGVVTLGVSATDGAGSGVARLCIDGASCILDGSTDDTSLTAGVVSTNVTVAFPSASGERTVTATAYDAVGNTSPLRSTTVRIDNVAPVVTLAPKSSAWANTAVVVSATATDVGSGVNQLCVTDPAGSTTCGTTNPASVTVDVPDGTAGSRTVSASATDAAGNPSLPDTTTVNIDRAAPTAPAPTVTPDADNDGVYVVGETVSVTFSCGDVGSGIKSCELLQGTTVISTNASGVSATVPVIVTTPGPQSFTVRATDVANNPPTTSSATSINVGYGVCLMYDATQAKSIGSNYTIKLQLCDAARRNLSSSAITLTGLTIDGSILPGPNFQGSSNLGFVFRFNATDSSYIYNLDTNGLLAGDHKFFFTTGPVPTPRPATAALLQPLATNFAPFKLR